MSAGEANSNLPQSVANQHRLRTLPLFRFGIDDSETWTVGDSLEGTQIFGATGSGKTSGSGASLARAFLDAGYGGLVLTAKPDELQTWADYFRTSRSRDLSEVTIIEPGPPYPAGRHWPAEFDGKVQVTSEFNLLDYEFSQGGHTQNLVSLFLNALSSGGSAVSRQEPFWDEALREQLTHAIDLVVLAGHRVNLPELVELVRSAPRSAAEVSSGSWWKRNGRCQQLILDANKWSATPAAHNTDRPRRDDLAQTLHYWLVDFPRLNDRTRSIIVTSFTAKAAGLLRSPLREMFCRHTDQRARPEETHRGRVLILHLPVKLYGEVGRFAQVLYKTIWQRATERRHHTLVDSTQWRPVFLWADEAQYFLTPEDMQYQMTARSAFAATVYLTQNISSYYAMMSGTDPRSAVDSFLGNLQTKIFHANGDAVTNQWAERLFADTPRTMIQRALSGQGDTASTAAAPQIPAVKFTELKKGGNRDGIVEAYLFQAGRSWRVESQRHGEADRRYKTEFRQPPRPTS